jgi:hypothetical protein
MDTWRALVKMVMNLRVLYNAGTFLAVNLLASQEELCCMELVIYNSNIFACWIVC